MEFSSRAFAFFFSSYLRAGAQAFCCLCPRQNFHNERYAKQFVASTKKLDKIRSCDVTSVYNVAATVIFGRGVYFLTRGEIIIDANGVQKFKPPRRVWVAQTTDKGSATGRQASKQS